MKRDDILAGQAYVLENWEAFSDLQKLGYYRFHHPDKEVRDRLDELFVEGELVAKAQAVAPWYEPDNERLEARFAALLARKFGVNWWRDAASVLEKLGIVDDAWHATKIEPKLQRLANEVPKPNQQRFGLAERIAAGAAAAPQTINATPEQRATVERIFGPIKAELKMLGLPSDDLWQVVAYADRNGINVDDPTYGEVHEIVCQWKMDHAKQGAFRDFDAMDRKGGAPQRKTQPPRPRTDDEIPQQHRTEAMSIKSRAVAYFKNVEWTTDHKCRELKRMMDGGEIRRIKVSDRRWIFDARQI